MAHACALTQLSFYLPPPIRLTQLLAHPQAAEIERQADAWAWEHRSLFGANPPALEEFLQQRPALWPCLCYPHADAKRLLLFCQWHHAGLMLDDPDAVDPSSEDLTAISSLSSGGTSSASGIVQLLQQVWVAMISAMPAGQRNRARAAHDEMFKGFEEERALMADDGAPCLQDALEVRRRSSGLGWCLVAAEYLLGVDLTQDMAASPDLVQLGFLAREQMLHFNEIFSFRKEYFSGELNLVGIEAGPGLHGLDAAVGAAHARAAAAERRFVQLRDRICTGPLSGRADVLAYTRELGHMMAGSLRWHYLSPRYHGPGHIWNGVEYGRLSLTPERTQFPHQATHQ